MAIQVSGTNAAFLRKEFLVPKIYEIMNPYLFAIDLLPKVRADSRSVRIRKDSYSEDSDPKKSTPPYLTAGADFPMVDITLTTVDAAILAQKGFAVQVDRDAINFTEGIDIINRTFTRVAYWLAQAFNTDVTSALTGGATTPTWTPTAVWSDGAATPVDDLIALGEQMEREGYPYRMTDVYVHKTNFYELLRYLTGADIDGAKQRDLFGVPNVMKSEVYIPAAGCTVHSLLSGIDEGYVLATDRNNPGASIFYYNDPDFGTRMSSYRVSDGTTVNAGGIGFNFHQFVDDETHNTVMQFWWDTTTKVLESYAILYDSGI